MSLYGIIIGICLALTAHHFSRHNYAIPKNQEGVFLALLSFFAFIGARLYHIIDQWAFYSQNLAQIPNTRAGGLGIFGALIGGFIFILIYSQITRIYIVDILDPLIPILPLCQSLGRIGNFLNQEAFGAPTYIRFGQYIPPQNRPLQYQLHSYFHPVWLYEAILCLILFLLLRRVKFHQISWYLIGYGSIRFFTEFFRFDTWVINDFKVAHILSLGFVLTGVLTLLVDKLHQPSN